MKVVSNTCDKEFGGEMKSFYKNYFKSSLDKSHLQKSLPFREMYAKYQEKNSI